MEGSKKFQEIGQKLKAEVAAKEELETERKEAAITQLQKIQNNPELAKFFSQNAMAGAENVGGSYPYLRIHTANSTINQLPDGSLPKDGSYFYAPTKQEFPEITAHILTISRGFRMWQVDKKNGERKKQYNQIVGGVIVDQGKTRPYLMYVNGLKCQPVWTFGKEINMFTRSGIPMFSLVVEMTTEQVKSDYGFKWVPKFEVIKNGTDPEIVTDIVMLKMLRRGVDKLNDSIKQIIEVNEIKENGAIEPTIAATEANGEVEETDLVAEEPLSTEDIPF